ncbi:uncharacterized protein [Littorina saxatilis]|uniref:uncharacterized protein n=1 Tax=Littorina saxatilis TaxID=31220 RepID=UPI0038B6A386
MDRSKSEKQKTSDGAARPSSPVTTANPADEDSGKEKKKRKLTVIPRLEGDKFHLPCEWGECQTVSCNMDAFIAHVSTHIMEYFAQVPGPIASSGMCFTCGWRDCGAQILGSVIDFNRHVYFHVFHVRLKCLGAHMARILGLGTCMLGSQSCNWIPELPEHLQCTWTGCKIIFDNPYVFYSHVLHHCEVFPEGNNTSCKCLWEGCTTLVRSKHKMKDHLRSHTQEKQVACPTCGGLFVSHTKLTDHILRQANSDTQRYECSHCSRRFATERMLREHMRRHVNHYKCPLCDMTCPCPSALRNHMRYRHSDEKPFKCGHCEFSAKSSYDLRKHLDSHNVEDQFTCHIPHCPFSARSYSSLDLHFKKHHQNMDVDSTRYRCHVCSRVFHRGYSLTFHLKKKHHFQWPPGHSRFKYKMHSDGFLRLQTVRYESVDVTEPSASNGKGSEVTSAAVPAKSRKKKCIVTTSVTAPPPQDSDDAGDDDGENGEEEEGRNSLRIDVNSCEPAPISTDDANNPVAIKASKRKNRTRARSSRKRKSGGKESDRPVGSAENNTENGERTVRTESDADVLAGNTEVIASNAENDADAERNSAGLNGMESKTARKARAKRNRATTGSGTRKSGRRSESKNKPQSEETGVEHAENSAETAVVSTLSADLQHTDSSVRDSNHSGLEAASGNLSVDEGTVVAKSSRKRKRQSRSPTKRKRATLTQQSFLDECPPEMVEIQWQDEPLTKPESSTGELQTQRGYERTGARLYEEQQSFIEQSSALGAETRIMRINTGPWVNNMESELTSVQSSSAYGFRQRNVYAAEQVSVPSVQGLGTETYAVYKNYDHTEEFGTVEQTGEQQSVGVESVSMPDSSHLQALGLRVAEYGDSAEANLHMLGDVALTSLRVPKEKTPVLPTRTSRRTRRK